MPFQMCFYGSVKVGVGVRAWVGITESELVRKIGANYSAKCVLVCVCVEK